MVIKYYRYVVKAKFASNPFKVYTYGKYKTENEAIEKAFEVKHHIEKGVDSWVEKQQFSFVK